MGGGGVGGGGVEEERRAQSRVVARERSGGGPCERSGEGGDTLRVRVGIHKVEGRVRASG